MRKILTIAAREYRSMVGTKAFLISIIMVPLLMFGSILAMEMLGSAGEIQDRKIVVVDGTKKMLPPMKMAVLTHNNQLEQKAAAGKDDDVDISFSKGYRYELIEDEATEIDDARRFELCQQIRQGEIYAFVEIPADVELLDEQGDSREVRFYSEDSSISESRMFMRRVIGDIIRDRRLNRVQINPEQVKQASLPVPIRGLGLIEQTADGAFQDAVERDEITAIMMPMMVMMLMFMVIFLASQPMLESVLEEKSQRIAEVLLGSANTTHLMFGKLLGTVGGSLTIVAVYIVGAIGAAYYRGWSDQIPFEIFPWFVIFQVFGVLFFASIFLAVGASVSQLKEAQSMLLPVWMLLMSPMFIWFYAVQEPNGVLARWFSLIPPATPTMMMLRMATGATIPLWQPILGIVLLALSTILCVFIAGRIFRVGLLWQGKTPKLTEIARWALSG